MPADHTAAFFRVEGSLLERGSLAAAARLVGNRQGFRERAWRLGHLAVAAPLFGLIGQNDRTLANRLTYAACRGMTEDRIAVLAEEYYDEVLLTAILESGRELVRNARRAGHRIVLISEGIEPVIGKLRDDIRGVDDLLCNQLEIVDGEATGRLREPVFGGHEVGRWIAEYAENHRIDLARSVAYGSHGPDLLLLAAVGQPCAVNPDFTLRRAATDSRWAVLDYAA
jgi:phosphoserine phosphatase